MSDENGKSRLTEEELKKIYEFLKDSDQIILYAFKPSGKNLQVIRGINYFEAIGMIEKLKIDFVEENSAY